jgi:hypothetical protein
MIDHVTELTYTSTPMPKSISFWEHPVDRIEEALLIRKQIAALQAKLSSMFGSSDESTPAVKGKRGGKRTMSPATIAKMRAAQQARWANKRGATESQTSTTAAKPAKRKSKMSAAGRAAIVAAQKARWAKIRGESTPASATAKPAKTKKRTMSPEARAKIAAAAKKRWAARKAGK